MPTLSGIGAVVMLAYAIWQYVHGNYEWMAIDLVLASGLLTMFALYCYFASEKPDPDRISTEASRDW